MITNFLKTKCTIQDKTTVAGPLGETESWADRETRWCRRVSVGVATRIAYMQNNTVVTDKFLFDGLVSLSIGQQRIIYRGEIYELAAPAQHYDNQTTVLVNGGS